MNAQQSSSHHARHSFGSECLSAGGQLEGLSTDAGEKIIKVPMEQAMLSGAVRTVEELAFGPRRRGPNVPWGSNSQR